MLFIIKHYDTTLTFCNNIPLLYTYVKTTVYHLLTLKPRALYISRLTIKLST